MRMVFVKIYVMVHTSKVSMICFPSKINALQVQLYYDDIETTNLLGSKKGIHKLGCIYFTLRNLPPKCYSVLMNNHVVALSLRRPGEIWV